MKLSRLLYLLPIFFLLGCNNDDLSMEDAQSMFAEKIKSDIQECETCNLKPSIRVSKTIEKLAQLGYVELSKIPGNYGGYRYKIQLKEKIKPFTAEAESMIPGSKLVSIKTHEFGDIKMTGMKIDEITNMKYAEAVFSFRPNQIGTELGLSDINYTAKGYFSKYDDGWRLEDFYHRKSN